MEELIKFIENNFDNGNSLVQLKNLELLILYLKEHKILLKNLRNINTLIDKSIKLNNMLQKIVLLDDSEEIYKNDNISLLIDIYLDEKNDEILMQSKYKYNSDYYLYIKEISKYNLLTKEEEYDLATRIKNGDTVAREKLINSNLKLVVKIALTFKHNEHNIMDLIGYGNEGLIKAVEKYDCEKYTRFSTYAGIVIRRKINRSIQNNSKSIRFPIHLCEKLPKINQFIESYNIKYNQDPSYELIAKEFNMKPETVKSGLETKEPISFYLSIMNDDDETNKIIDIVGEENNIEDRITEKEIIKYIINTDILNDEEKKVLIYRYGLIDNKCKTQPIIGRIMGKKRQRIDQIEKKALLKLRFSPFIQGYYDKNTDKYKIDISNYSDQKILRLCKEIENC